LLVFKSNQSFKDDRNSIKLPFLVGVIGAFFLRFFLPRSSKVVRNNGWTTTGGVHGVGWGRRAS
jgi:hypothetical protein